MKYMPPFTVRFSQGSDSPCQELVAGKHFHLGLDAVEQLFWTNLSPRLLDFLRVAMSVYVADRLGRRKQQSQERRWFRSLKLSVAVQEPEFWESDEVFATLMECLDFLSEDAWDLKFVKDRREQPPHVARFLPGDNPFAAVPPLVCLYSGGTGFGRWAGHSDRRESRSSCDPGNGLAPTKPKRNRSPATGCLERAIRHLNSPPDRQGGNGMVLRLEGMETRKEPAMPVLLVRGCGRSGRRDQRGHEGRGLRVGYRCNQSAALGGHGRIESDQGQSSAFLPSDVSPGLPCRGA